MVITWLWCSSRSRMAVATTASPKTPPLPHSARAYVAANRGKLSYGSIGVGSGTHLSGAQLSKALGGHLSHVPYKGSAQLIRDLASGQIPLAFATIDLNPSSTLASFD